VPALAAACGGGSKTAAGHADHTDSGSHTDHADHADAAHNDSSHSDAIHTDSNHTDKGHGDTAHSDSSTHSDTTHKDTHKDTAHTDTPHGDFTGNARTIHDDSGGPHADSTQHGSIFIPANGGPVHNDYNAFTDHQDSGFHADNTTNVPASHDDTPHGDK
jgi:hypothetical protein